MAAESDVRSRPALDWTAIGLALAGAGAVAFGSLAGTSVLAGRSVAADPIRAAAILAVVVQVVVPVAAVVAARRGRWRISLGLLLGSGPVALAQFVADGQLIVAPIDANRFEMARPVTAAELAAGPGAYSVLIGHVVCVAAAIVAAVALGARDDHDSQADETPLAIRQGWLWSICTVFAAIALAVAAFANPWRVTDPVIVSTPALDGPWFLLSGTVLLGFAVLAGVAAVLTATAADVAGAALVGIGVAAGGIVGTRWVAGLADDGIDPSGATIVASIAAAVLAVAGALVSAHVPLPDLRSHLGGPKWRLSPNVSAGVAGLTASVSIGVGSAVPLITVPAGVAEPTIYAARTALVAAAVLGAVAIWLLLSEFAAPVRPALGMVSVAVLMVCAGVLNSVVEAQRVGATGVGVGAVLVGIGALCCAAAGVAAVVGGAYERDTVDRSGDSVADQRLLGLGGAAAGAGVVALALPLYSGSSGAATSFAFPWGWDTWGQLGFAVALVGVAFVGPRSRPRRAVALYGGAAAGLAIHLAGWPLTSSRVADATVSAGVPAATLAIVLFIAAGAVALRTPD